MPTSSFRICLFLPGFVFITLFFPRISGYGLWTRRWIRCWVVEVRGRRQGSWECLARPRTRSLERDGSKTPSTPGAGWQDEFMAGERPCVFVFWFVCVLVSVPSPPLQLHRIFSCLFISVFYENEKVRGLVFVCPLWTPGYWSVLECIVVEWTNKSVETCTAKRNSVQQWKQKM